MPRWKRRRRTVVRYTAFIAVVAALSTAGLGMRAQAASRNRDGGVKPVEVCMVTDRVFGEPQIPVLFEGRTYYGCCQGCVNRIKNDRSVRYSTDPVTGREVDKASAYIVEGPGGEALYFESAGTAMKYGARAGR